MKPMTFLSRSLLSLLLLVLLVAGCDTSEDPNLLNPPLPDSTLVRLVNLIPGEDINAVLATYPLSTALGSLQATAFQPFFFTARVNLEIFRANRRDTLRDQALDKSGRLTYFILGTGDRTTFLQELTGKQEELDLAQRNVAKLVFINAIADSPSVSYVLRSGCLSGDTLFRPQSYGTRSAVETDLTSLSLYLFGTGDSLAPATTARVNITPGTVTYLIAARDNGVRRLYVLSSSSNDNPGALPEAQPETRTEATVELLNANADATPISVGIKGGAQIATDLPSLQISPATTAQACTNPLGDSLAISGSIASASAPIRLSVGTRTLIVVYDKESSAKALTLNRDVPSPAAGKIYLRGVNVSTVAPLASISVGAGAPSGVAESSRPFGTLGIGEKSRYVELPEGDFPLILRDASTGEFKMAGVEHFTSGYYTLFIIDYVGSPEIRILRDDQPGTSLSPLGSAGTLATFFNMMPDVPATFTIGSLQLGPIAYSYTSSTVLPAGVTTISSNAGETTIDPLAGGYMIGATGSGSNRQVIAFRSPVATSPEAQAAIRFLNAVSDAPELNVHIGSIDVPPITASFGVPTAQFAQEERRYTFIVTRPGDPTVVARLDGIELLKRHSYVLVIGPQRDGVVGGTTYGTLLLQE